MRIARVARPEGMYFALVEGEGNEVTLYEIEGYLFGQLNKTGRSWPPTNVCLFAPILLSKVIATGRNYADHVAEVFKKSVESLPLTMLIEPPTAVTGPEALIRIPDLATNVEFKDELVLAIGKPRKNIKKENAYDVIFGHIIANDVSSRDLQLTGDQWACTKGIDTFYPLGPWIQTELDYNELPIRTYSTHEGATEIEQDSSPNRMIMSIPEIIEFVIASITLLSGDVICTGSPAGTAAMFPGDHIEIEILSIGKLTNLVERT